MEANIYKPYLMRIAAVTDEAPGVRTFRLEFADAKERDLRELTGAEALKLRLLRRVLEVPVEGPHFRDVVVHPVKHRQLRQIDILRRRHG